MVRQKGLALLKKQKVPQLRLDVVIEQKGLEMVMRQRGLDLTTSTHLGSEL